MNLREEIQKLHAQIAALNMRIDMQSEVIQRLRDEQACEYVTIPLTEEDLWLLCDHNGRPMS